MSGFKKYQHVERLGDPEVEGIGNGLVYIFPKLDGANGSVWVEDTPASDRSAAPTGLQVCAGSRNLELSEGVDNAGFYAYVQEHSGMYLQYLGDHPSRILYGEWLVPHTIKDYEPWAWRRFYVFDVYDTVSGRYLAYDEYADDLDAVGIDVIPPLYTIENPSLSEDQLNTFLTTNFYLMKEGCLGEGVVIKNYGWTNRYGRQTWAKVVRTAFKENSRAVNKGGPEAVVEDRIVEALLTEEAITHEVLKFRDEYGDYTAGNYRELLGRVWKGWLEDNIWKIISKAGKNSVNFSTLRHKAEAKIKEYYPL